MDGGTFLVDMDSLMKGQNYTELKDSYILFICKYDPFEDENKKHFALPCYTFRNICEENALVNLDDKSIKVIYNATAYKDEKDERIRKLLKFICTNDPGNDDFSIRLSAVVEKIKENEKFRSEYAAMNLHDWDITRAAKKEGFEIGISQGAHDKAVETARKMLKDNVSLADVLKYTGLSEKEVSELKQEQD